jgi:ribosome biogenesis protein SSF1/2
MPRVGSRRKKSHSQKTAAEGETTGPTKFVSSAHTPLSLVTTIAEVSPALSRLCLEFRNIFSPATFTHLRPQKRLKVKDYVKAAETMDAKIIATFSKTDLAGYVKIGSLNQGPTTVFKLKEYVLSEDLRKSQKRPRGVNEKDIMVPPVLIMGGFDSGSLGKKSPDNMTKGLLEVVKTQFESFLPPMNIEKVNLKSVRRVVYVEHKEGGIIQIRHYAVKVKNASVSRNVSKLLRSISSSSSKRATGQVSTKSTEDLVNNAGAITSDSEIDDTVAVDGPVDGLNYRSIPVGAQIGVKLVELGPRIDLEIVKIESGLYSGEVLFHAHVEKEVEKIDMLQKEADLKLKRREDEEKRVLEKRKQRNELKKKMIERKVHHFNQVAGEDQVADQPSFDGENTSTTTPSTLPKKSTSAPGIIEFNEDEKTSEKWGKKKRQDRQDRQSSKKGSSNQRDSKRKGTKKLSVAEKFRKTQKRK